MKKQTENKPDDTDNTKEPVINAALVAALNNPKPLGLEALDALTDPNAEDPTVWLESSREQSRKELVVRSV